MINLQIGDNDLYGHRFNGHDLHFYLRERGIESKHLVWKKRSTDQNTFEIGKMMEARDDIHLKCKDLEKKLSIQCKFYELSHAILFDMNYLKADIVHYHLIHNSFFDISLFPLLTRFKASVWTIHDPWALTGHCIYPLDCQKWRVGCGNCPDLDLHFKIDHDTSALNWEIKKHYISQSDIDFIVASKYMEKQLTQSPIFHNKTIHVVPFGLDLNLFKCQNSKEAKKSFGISENDFVISFRATSSVYKGLDYIYQVLDSLNVNKSICLLTFNETGLFDRYKDKYNLIDLGWVFDDEKMIRAYNAADVFLMPSTAEAFGMMAMETMACGKPAIVFDGTSLPEVIKAPSGGIAVPMGNIKEFTYELESLILDDNRRLSLGNNARRIAEENYEKNRYVNDIIAVYEEIIDKRVIDQRSVFIIEQLENIVQSSSNNDERVRSSKAEDSNTNNDTLKADKINELKDLFNKLIAIKFISFLLFYIAYPILKFCLKVFRVCQKRWQKLFHKDAA